MFSRDELARAVELQKRSYLLLQWVASAVRRGIVSFKVAHSYSSTVDAAMDWIQRHYLNIPDDARPPQADLRDFSGLFSTYLQNSFELEAKPRMRLYSPDAHCFCPICSWLIDAPNLTPKTPMVQDKKRARKMMREVIQRVAGEHGMLLPEQTIESMIDDPAFRENLALCAYGYDLFQRMHGIAVGAASLVLWRSFAWLPTGSPKKKFELTAELIHKAEDAVRERVLAYGIQ